MEMELLRIWKKNMGKYLMSCTEYYLQTLTEVTNSTYLHHELTTQATEDTHPA